MKEKKTKKRTPRHCCTCTHYDDRAAYLEGPGFCKITTFVRYEGDLECPDYDEKPIPKRKNEE